jgi:dihydrofolate synthase/folylpolyglutamate synthase
MDFDEALGYLSSLGHETVAIKLGLAATERMLGELGQPQRAYRSVQIAGTNGKGSTAIALDAILRAAGIKVGLYTSPHLISITERIRLSGLEITPGEFARLITQVRDTARTLLERRQLAALPTSFEHLTIAAFLLFKEAGAELAILETGLGGRLDATTTARARLVALTPIALDHQEYLGHTLAEIAAEKAAIIRPGVTAIVAPQTGEALEVILKQCAANDVVPHILKEEDVTILGADEYGRLKITVRTPSDCYENVRPRLLGRHQTHNVAVAIRLAEALRESGFNIPRAAIIEGVEAATHMGRLERWEGSPSLLFDGAHNGAGARALRAFLDEFVHVPITLVFGAMRDKALDEMAALLFPAASLLIFTAPRNPRASEPEELARVAMACGIDSSRIMLAASSEEASRIARAHTPARGLILYTGSLYLVGEIESALQAHIRHVSRGMAGDI